MISGDFEPWAKAFPKSLLPELFRCIVAQWPQFIRPLRHLENRITVRFVAHLQRSLRGQLPFGFQPRQKLVAPDADTESGEVDITVHAGIDPLVFFGFECKRLNILSRKTGRVNSNASEYVGKDGMECFTSGRYHGGGDSAGMLGYVMDGRVDDARAAVDRAVVRRRLHLGLLPPQHLHSADLAPDLTDVLKTLHRTQAGIRLIYHLLLPFDSPIQRASPDPGDEIRQH